MLWPMIAVALGFLGLAVVAVPAVRVAFEVRRLAGRLDDASLRISGAARELERSAAAVARQAGPGDDLPGSGPGR